MERKNNLSIKNKVEAALDSINDIKPATPSPYFFTKVLAKMSNANVTVWEEWSAIFLRPTIAFASICFIVVINAFVVYSKIEDNFLPVNQTGQSELAVSDEYSETGTALYDLENVKP